MFNRSLALAFLAALLVASSGANAVERITIGNANLVVKTVTGVFEADRRRIQLLDDIYHNELVETGEESATEFVFLDETKLSMGPNSSMVLDRFVFDPDPDLASFVMTATTGVFRFVSGNLPKASYEINTPTATIGIRGTVFTVVVVPDLANQAAAKVNVTVEEGIAEITSCRGVGVTLVDSGHSTTISASGSGENCLPPSIPGPQPAEFASMVDSANLAGR